MVKERRVDLGGVFAALAHPIRRAILARLAEGECTVGDLSGPHRVSRPAISKHLWVLKGALAKNLEPKRK